MLSVFLHTLSLTPLRQGLSLNVKLIDFQLCWWPASLSDTLVSALQGLGYRCGHAFKNCVLVLQTEECSQQRMLCPTRMVMLTQQTLFTN